ncbi:MAG: hypothetical protein ACYC35_11035 [Pirellulales bacterium]
MWIRAQPDSCATDLAPGAAAAPTLADPQKAWRQARLEELTEAHTTAFSAKDYKTADALAMELMDLVVNDPDILADRGFQLSMLAMECEETADWNGAEAAHREALTVESQSNFGTYKAHEELSAFYGLLGRDAEALEEAHLATAAARRDDTATMLLMALDRESATLIRQGRVAEALPLVAESFKLLEEDDCPDVLRAAGHVVRAECRIKQGELAAASGDLDRVVSLLTPLLEMSSAGGAYGVMARCHVAMAHLHSTKGDPAAEVEAWSKAVDYARHVASLPHLETVYSKAALAKTLEKLAASLESTGQHARASTCRSEAEVLWNAARLPSHP